MDVSRSAITPRGLNRATLARQLLLRREPLSPAEGLRRVGALQAQEPASPYLALWARLVAFDPADLDDAFVRGDVVRASLMRLTLHAVHAEDYPAFHAAMTPSLRASRLRDRRFTESGLSTDDVDRLLPDLRRFLATPRTIDEIEELVEDRLGEREPRAWWALRTFAPLHHAPTDEPWSFARPASFVAAPTTLDPEDHDRSVQWLVRRYLAAFGPASVRDIAQFTMLRTPILAKALEALSAEVHDVEAPDGSKLFDVPGAPRPPDDTHAPARLLPMWDSTLLAYTDRSRIIPPDIRPLVIRRNGDVLPAVLVDGYVAGTWRAIDGGVEIATFRRIDESTWAELAEEASGLTWVLAARDPDVYRRYARWWGKLTPEQVRRWPV